MRKSEILNLTWDRVDFVNSFIFVERTKNGESRQIPINNTLMKMLKSLPRRVDIDYVFYNPYTGKNFKYVIRSFKTSCKLAKIQNCTFHTLRHTFASHLIMMGVDLTTVKELMGHKEIKMTLRYAHLAPNHISKAVTVLDKIFGTGQKLDNCRGSRNANTS